VEEQANRCCSPVVPATASMPLLRQLREVMLCTLGQLQTAAPGPVFAERGVNATASRAHVIYS
jgi:hypothetical protein